MSATRFSAAEKDLEKFIKFLAMKSAQVVVQSRLGEKVQTQCNPQASGNDWFNIVIQDHPDVVFETRKALALNAGDSIIQRLPLCIEISLQTIEGDKMVLEVWSLAIHPEQADPTLRATHTIYNRMGILLKSLISVTRGTPGYKLSRQSSDSYHIYYRIYVDDPQIHNLGEGFKQVRVGQLSTSVGTLSMSVAYRTKMTISPTQTGRDTTIMLKSDHFLNLSPKNPRYYNNKKSEKRVIDLDKPLRPGAFADVSKLKVYTEEDYILPETPPFAWLLRKNNEFCACKPKEPTTPEEDESCTTSEPQEIKNNNNNAKSNQSNDVKMMSQASPKDMSGISTAHSSLVSSDSANEKTEKSRWYEPLPGDDKLLKEMHFPFATNRNSQSSDLAKFIRSCFNPPKLQQYEEATPDDDEINDDATKQWEQFETNLVDFDTLMSSLTLPPLDDNSNS